jgi:cell division protease FtsH
MAPALLSAPPALVRGSRRAARRSATRCAAASAPALPAVAPPAVVVAPASRGVFAAAPAGLAGASLSAPSPLWTLADAEAAVATATAPAEALPEASSWRYSEFIDAVTRGKVERVRFSKDGSSLQLTAVDGCAAAASRRGARSPGGQALFSLARSLLAWRCAPRCRLAAAAPC